MMNLFFIFLYRPRYIQKINFETFGLERFLKIYLKLVVCTEQLNYKNIWTRFGVCAQQRENPYISSFFETW